MSRKPPSKSSRSSQRNKLKGGSSKRARRRRKVGLAEVKDDLSRYLRLAEREEILITRHGKPAGVLIGFGSDEDWLEYRLEHHPEFLDTIAKARRELETGQGIRLEEIRD